MIMGAILAVPHSLINYAVQPWPATVVVTWIMGYFIEFIIAGVLVSLVYQPKTATATQTATHTAANTA
jgi:hypothetical protein